MANHGHGSQVLFRVYMEGRYIANGVSSIIMSSGEGAPSTCQLSMVPTETIRHIMPFTWVHVFTTDPWNPDPKGDLSDFSLAFEGVVIGSGFAKEDSGRSFVVQCADPQIFWVQARQFWMNIAQAGGGIIDQLVVQTSGGYGRFGMLESTGTYGYMVSKLSNVESDPEERFLDTLISVLDDIGNVNPAYSNARNRFRITDRILRGSAGNSEKLFQMALMTDFLNGLANRSSGQTNLAEVVNQLLDSIMHEWCSILAPPYIKSTIFERDIFGHIKRTKTKVNREFKDGTKKVDLYEFSTAEDSIIGSTIFKPHIYTLSPPTCNVLFPNMYESVGIQRSFLDEPTRVSMKPNLPFRGLEPATAGMLFLRPTELEIFTALTRDVKKGARGTRTPDGQFGDGAGQVPNFHDYDWTTNEERIRGIVYNFVNLAPAPSTLTLSDQGKRQPDGTRKGGVPKYLQNVASYEYYKSKFASRTNRLSGPYNIKPVCGFSMLVLDDSDAKMNMVGYLTKITHSINAQGQARTEYDLKYTRLADEIDWNRPKFVSQGASQSGTIDFNLARGADGSFEFSKLFDGYNRPPVPEWFSNEFRTLTGLDVTYRKWFGENCRVVESVLFKNPDAAKATTAQKATSVGLGNAAALAGAEGLAVAASNEYIDILDAIAELVKRYKGWRTSGREFAETSSFVNRSTTSIDQAFRFVGAGPFELADVKAKLQDINQPIVFKTNPANKRVIDYKKVRFDLFIGDTSPGSGYAGVREGEKNQLSATTNTTVDGTVIDSSTGNEVDAVSGATPVPQNRMNGAFPLFDTRVHTGLEATDDKARKQVLRSESSDSDWARFDGRPVMYDFEFRLWLESLKASGLTPTGEAVGQDAINDYYAAEGGTFRPATPAEQAAAAQARTEALKAKADKDRKAARAGKAAAKQSVSHTPRDQAPTGDGLEENKRLPLPQPLAEYQTVLLRRAIIDQYNEELEKTRGFAG